MQKPSAQRRRVRSELGLLAQLTALHAGAAQHLAVLLLGHALAALLDDRTHNRRPHFLLVRTVNLPASPSGSLLETRWGLGKIDRIRVGSP